ncbi:MAG: aminoacetone oxidase family FAD-binding enzyme [Rickettsiales bacterium]|nr:aminoacetone oxidase family FAD-binding enzyme [Rickettsiales bacterium]
MQYDVIIIGAGAAGLMCAIEAGKRGRRVLLLDKAAAVGEKIRISGGGRCNFTNIHTTPANYLSQNPHFCISALRRYTPAHFIALVEKHRIAYHEKTLGQLFCDGSSKQIIAMLLSECEAAGVGIRLRTDIIAVSKTESGFAVTLQGDTVQATSLVIATGGPSIPKMGATGWGYDIARQFGLAVIPPRAALVPFTLADELLQYLRPLSGIAVDAIVRCHDTSFREGMLFTHRGLSGPSILQLSSYWQEGEPIQLNLLPELHVLPLLKTARDQTPKLEIATILSKHLPKKLVQTLCEMGTYQGRIGECGNATMERLSKHVHAWSIVPNGTEGYRTAEVTLGGVDTQALSSKTFEATTVPGLYFIGEVVDVTGHLGGFNFQWAWASGFAAGQAV